jgi:hypothetical protein
MIRAAEKSCFVTVVRLILLCINLEQLRKTAAFGPKLDLITSEHEAGMDITELKLSMPFA